MEDKKPSAEAYKKAKELGIPSKMFKRYFDSFEDEEKALEFCKLPPKVRQNELRKRSYIKKYGVPYRVRSEEELKKFSNSMKNKSAEEKKEINEKKRATKVKHFGDPNYANVEKIKKTNLERYGSETYNNREKFKQTKLEKYGDANYVNSEKAKQTWANKSEEELAEKRRKLKETLKERYGDENYYNLEKVKKTNIEKYGVEFIFQNDEIKEKAFTTKEESYGNRNYNNSEKAKQTWLNKTCDELNSIVAKSKSTKFEKYGDENFVNIEKIQQAKLERYGDANYVNAEKAKQTWSSKSEEEIKHIVERRSKTCNERYGVSNAAASEEVKEKIKQTFIERYGVENPMSVPNIRERAQHTWTEKYGVSSPFESLEIREKAQQTFLEKYGANSPLSSTDVRRKLGETNAEKYGSSEYFKSEDFREKATATLIDKYGVTSPLASPEIREKAKTTWLKNYGVENPLASPEIRERIKDTLIERYGVAHPLSYKYEYDKESFDSSWELAFWIYNKDHGINITKSNKHFGYLHDGKEHNYFPDFDICGSQIEIKGEQFFKEDGSMQNPYDHSLDSLFEAKHQCMLNNNVTIMRGKDLLDEISYVEEKYTKDFIGLFRKDLPFPYPNQNLEVKTDMGLIRHFHKSIYDAHRVRCISPKEAWENKELIKKSALNRLKYVGRCKPQDVLTGFSVAKIAPKVSVFKPELAAELIEKFLPGCKMIFDPFSGFSGRMLGAAKLGVPYEGQDLNEDHVRESNEIIEFKQLKNCSVKVQDIFSDRNRTIEGCLFTCSPYEDKEVWNNEDKNFACDEWVDICLEKYKCNKYLFVVDNTEKYKDNIVMTIKNKSHFGSNSEYVVLIEN